MGFFDKQLNQTLSYWEYDSMDGTGSPSFTSASPAERACRWEERQELFIDGEGEEQRSQAVVFIAFDPTVKGYMFLGGVDDLNSVPEDPLTQDGAYRVTAVQKVPDVKGTTFLRKVWLT